MSPSDRDEKCALCKHPIESSNGAQYTIALEADDKANSNRETKVPVCRTCWDNLRRDF